MHFTAVKLVQQDQIYKHSNFKLDNGSGLVLNWCCVERMTNVPNDFGLECQLRQKVTRLLRQCIGQFNPIVTVITFINVIGELFEWKTWVP